VLIAALGEMDDRLPPTVISVDGADSLLAWGMRMRRPADRPPEKQEVASDRQSPGGSRALHASGDADTHGTAATSMPARRLHVEGTLGEAASGLPSRAITFLAWGFPGRSYTLTCHWKHWPVFRGSFLPASGELLSLGSDVRSYG
jgi:hypothetical protein